MVSVFQIGWRMRYAVPRALERKSMLSRLYTDLCQEGSMQTVIKYLSPVFPPTWMEKWEARRTELPGERIVDYPFVALRSKFSGLAIKNEADSCRHFMRWDERIGNKVLRDLKQDTCDFIYLFNTAAYTVLRGNRSVKGILEQCSLPYSTYREAVIRESAKYPDWTNYSTPVTGADSEIKEFIHREESEWTLAEKIVCPSVHVAQDLSQKGIDPNKITIIPYGFNYGIVPKLRQIKKNSRLRVGTVGYLSIRKGIHHFYQTILKYPVAEYVAVGPRGFDLTDSGMELLADKCRLTGQLSSRSMESEYKSMDVLLFLTIGEGSATVVYEALSLGIPVVTTRSCGSIVEDGVSGFIVDPDDYDKVVYCLELLSDPDFYGHMSEQAILRSAFGSTRAYTDRLIAYFEGLSTKRSDATQINIQ